MPLYSLLPPAPGIRLNWDVDRSCRLVRASRAARGGESQWLKSGKPCMCPLALMMLVNCHKQETQHLWRLTGLEGIREIYLH